MVFFFSETKAEEQTIVDTIYVRCFQENQNTKYHFLSGDRESFNTNFSFNVKWVLYGYKKESISFLFNSKQMHMKPGTDWFVPMIDTNTIKHYKNVYTLEQFTKELEKENFFLTIFYKKAQLVMLYGAASLSKVEVYPVEVSTYLASH